MKEIKIVLADEHPVLRMGMASYIKRHNSEIKLLGEASSWDSLLSLLKKEEECDIVLLDVMIPGGDGLNMVKNCKLQFPNLKFLIVSSCPEEEYAVRFINAGASGYVSKSSSLKDIVDAVSEVSNGEIVISNYLMKRLAFEKLQVNNLEANPCDLTDREFQVMCQMAAGKSPFEVAELLNLSPKTVSTHRNNILRKMNWQNNAQLMFYAMKKGLVK